MSETIAVILVDHGSRREESNRMLEMMGGMLDCTTLSLGRNGGEGIVNLFGGTIYCDMTNPEGFQIPGGKLTVTGGKLTLAGDQQTIVDGDITAGKIVGGEPAGSLPLRVNYDGANTILYAGWAADFDNDGDVDGSDFDHLQACATGPEIPLDDASCADADLDLDNDVDQEDFGHLQECFTGMGVPQNNPACADALLDDDMDVDEDDFDIFESCLSGPNVPVNPSCDD